ncbi:MAG: hypothetical protein RIR94_423 [Bacteroidota bacterium]|jgi:hypothetical protein
MKLFYTLLFALLSLSSWSQTVESQLSKSYSKEEIAQFKADNSLSLYTYALEHACYLITAPQGKDLSQFDVLDLPSKASEKPLNFTDLGFKILDRTQYFKVANSDKILVVKSKNVLSLEMQNQKK